VLADRVPHHGRDLVVQALRVGHGTGVEAGEEVPLELDPLTGPDVEERAGLDAADGRVHRLGLRHVLEHQVVLQCPPVQLLVDAERAGQLQQALLLAGERDAAGPTRPVQRLDAELVPRPEDDLLLRVPDQEREHAAQLPDRVRPEVVVGRDDRLTVTLRVEPHPEPVRELHAQLAVVVDLPVEVQRVAGRVLRRTPDQRLVRVLEVDEPEPVEAVDDLTLCPRVGLVRPTVPLATHGRTDGVPPGGRVVLGGADKSKQTAHA
jgi:hypothetical protein